MGQAAQLVPPDPKESNPGLGLPKLRDTGLPHEDLLAQKEQGPEGLSLLSCSLKLCTAIIRM